MIFKHFTLAHYTEQESQEIAHHFYFPVDKEQRDKKITEEPNYIQIITTQQLPPKSVNKDKNCI